MSEQTQQLQQEMDQSETVKQSLEPQSPRPQKSSPMTPATQTTKNKHYEEAPVYTKKPISEVQMEHLKKARDAKKRLRAEKDAAAQNAENQLSAVNEQLATLKEEFQKMSVAFAAKNAAKPIVQIPKQLIDDYSDDDTEEIPQPPTKKAKTSQLPSHPSTYLDANTTAKVVAAILSASALMGGMYALLGSGNLGASISDFASHLVDGKPPKPAPWEVFQMDILGSEHGKKLAADKASNPLRVADY